ncbi:MAG: TatD family hydrolase, partial [Oscillospiraceae bacterium]|nr:TatD family hydrolase [Oscillospiraceae bacterium]
VPHRGERNESAYIPIIADFLARQKGVSLEEVAAVTTANAKRLFNL